MFETGEATLFGSSCVDEGVWRRGGDGQWQFYMLDPRYEPTGGIVRNISEHSWTDISVVPPNASKHSISIGLIGHHFRE